MSQSPTESINQQIHQRIRLLRPKQADHDFCIYTDGSGHKDGLGGAAAIVQQNRPTFRLTHRMLAQNGTSVLEMEFQGLLIGLQACLKIAGWDNKSKYKELRVTRPLVWWVTDREHLALSLWTHPDTGEHVNKRREPYALWKAFEFYEELFTITPIFEPRATIHFQHRADKLAGFGRSLMKNERPKFIEENPDIPL